MNSSVYAYLLVGLMNSGYGALNIALNKPVSQSSEWNNKQAALVVDGNRDGNTNHGSCTSTRSFDRTPWWMVDLGKPYAIHNITIVNRGDLKAEYLHDLFIETFRVHPITWSMVTAQHCFYYDGILSHVEILTCDEPTIGRYVRIRKIPRPGMPILMLCEVEIRGTALEKPVLPLSGGYNLACSLIVTRQSLEYESECVGMNLPLHKGKQLKTSIITTVSSSLLECAAICRYTSGCYDLNYNRMAQTCELVMIRSFSDVLVLDEHWLFATFP